MDLKFVSHILTGIGAIILIVLSWKFVVTGYYPSELPVLLFFVILGFSFLLAAHFIQRNLEKQRQETFLQELDEGEH